MTIALVDLFLGHHLLLVEVESQLQLVGSSANLLVVVEPSFDALYLLHLFLGTLLVLPEVRSLGTKILLLVLHAFLVYLQVLVQCVRTVKHIL